MHDPLLVGGVHDLADPLEQRHEPLQRDRPLGLEQLGQRRAAHELHGDPQEAVLLGAERVGMRGVGMIESRGEAGFTQEALDSGVAQCGACCAAP